MPVAETELYRRLCACTQPQLDYIEVQLEIPAEFTAQAATASRAKEILRLAQQKGKAWKGRLAEALNDAQRLAEDYIGGRLAHLKDFLAKPQVREGVHCESVGTIRQLREKLKEGKELTKPVLVRVRGTLFPAALLTAGWWERKQRSAVPLRIEWRNGLQRWLFKGFDLWAPSWDVCWGAVSAADKTEYHIAQLTEGDEADSLPVVVGRETAVRLSQEIKEGWGGFEVVVTGSLGHRKQFGKKLPANVRRDPLDYYICVDDDNQRHKINRLASTTDLYSGYLWTLLAPEEYVNEGRPLGLQDVYFVWEHTNFVAKQAVDYCLEGLKHKEELISRQHGGAKLVLLQKSHLIIPGEPHWPWEKFYNLYLGQGKAI